MQAENPYLDYLIDPSCQGVNRLFALSFKDNTFNTHKTFSSKRENKRLQFYD